MKRFFVTGLAAIIPIIITVYVIAGLFTFADGIIGKYINSFLLQHWGYEIPGLGIIISIIIVLLVGVIVRFSRMRFMRWMESAFFNLPLVNKIYFPIKRIVDFLFFPPHKTFRSVVLVEYPRKGLYSIGFLTNDSYEPFIGIAGRKLYNVFISSSPSPLTGFTVIVGEEDLTFLDISVEEAIKFVVSGGVLNPYER